MRSIVDRVPVWCWILAALVLLAIAAPVIAHSEPYVPLTLEQAKIYIGMISEDEIARQIVKLDWMEHAEPTAAVPALVTVLRGRDLVWNWSEALTVVLPGVQPGDKPAISYTIELKGGETKGFAPKDRSCEVTFWKIATLVSFLLGGGLGWLVHQ